MWVTPFVVVVTWKLIRPAPTERNGAVMINATTFTITKSSSQPPRRGP
jgi:hypothetical protein